MPQKRKQICKSVKRKVLDKFKRKCAYCGSGITYTNMSVDHIEALNGRSKAHSPHLYEVKNMNPSCNLCNSNKGRLSIDEWRIKIANRGKELSNSTSILLAYGLIDIIIIKKPVVFYFEKQKIEQ